MTTITIREQESTDSGFTATLSFDGRVNYPIAITDPFTPKQEQSLEWYFEQWLVFPQLGTVKAAQAKESVKSYGEQLFEQVFRTNIDAYSEYRQIRGNLSQIQIERGNRFLLLLLLLPPFQRGGRGGIKLMRRQSL
ncbi:hypothetical protein [Coleofasciculus sp. G2-EDA-02]|uniref:hypothetical protein n=1 Tax=Coleofasciculus sp. G2-EDA-02 TaxID=3069529 RepID=UPI003301100C